MSTTSDPSNPISNLFDATFLQLVEQLQSLNAEQLERCLKSLQPDQGNISTFDFMEPEDYGFSLSNSSPTLHEDNLLRHGLESHQSIAPSSTPSGNRFPSTLSYTASFDDPQTLFYNDSRHRNTSSGFKPDSMIFTDCLDRESRDSESLNPQYIHATPRKANPTVENSTPHTPQPDLDSPSAVSLFSSNNSSPFEGLELARHSPTVLDFRMLHPKDTLPNLNSFPDTNGTVPSFDNELNPLDPMEVFSNQLAVPYNGINDDILSFPTMAATEYLPTALSNVGDSTCTDSTTHTHHSPSPSSDSSSQNTSQRKSPRLDRNGRKPRVWKNRKYKCNHCNSIFHHADLASFAKHIREWERKLGVAAVSRKYKCDDENCEWRYIGFTRKLERDKHFKRKHGHPDIECPFWTNNGQELFPGARVCTTHWHTDSGNRRRHEIAVHGRPWSKECERMAQEYQRSSTQRP